MPMEDCASPDSWIPKRLRKFLNPPPSVRPGSQDYPRTGINEPVDAMQSDPIKAEADFQEELYRNMRRGNGELDRDRGAPRSFWSLMPIGDIFHEFEAATGIPLYRHFRRIEGAIDELNVHLKPWHDEVRAMVAGLPRMRMRNGQRRSWGVDNRTERMDVQVLFEMRIQSRAGGESVQYTKADVAKAEQQFGPSIVKAADLLEDLYRRFFKTEFPGVYTDADIDAFFQSFPTIRKNRGEKGPIWEAYNEARDTNVPPRMSTNPFDPKETIQEATEARRRAQRSITDTKIGRDLLEEFETSQLIIDDREWDFAQIASRIMRKKAEQKYMATAWNFARSDLKRIQSQIPREVYDTWMRYTSTVRRIPDNAAVSISRFMRRLDNAVFKVTKGKVSIGRDDPYLNLTSGWLSLNYMANMGFNPGVAIRNSTQPFLTSFPIIGNDLAHGLKVAMTPNKKIASGINKGKTYLEVARDGGWISMSDRPIQLQEMEMAMSSLGSDPNAGSRFGAAWNNYQKYGWAMFQKAETYTRMAAYFGMEKRALRAGKAFMKSDMGGAAQRKFMQDSRLELIVPESSPITTLAMDLMRKNPSNEGLGRMAHLLAKEHTNQSMFLYRQGNAPVVLQHSVGRMLGQYGTWPAWFVMYLRRLGPGGYGSRGARAKAIGRLFGVQTAIMGVGAEVFGMDLTQISMFAPLSYQGGPMVDVALNVGAKALTTPGDLAEEYLPPGVQPYTGFSKTRDPMLRMRAARAGEAYKQFVPAPQWAWRMLPDKDKGQGWGGEYVEMFEKEGFPAATRRFLGFQSMPEERGR
jgi:hypothetical protein